MSTAHAASSAVAHPSGRAPADLLTLLRSPVWLLPCVAQATGALVQAGLSWREGNGRSGSGDSSELRVTGQALQFALHQQLVRWFCLPDTALCCPFLACSLHYCGCRCALIAPHAREHANPLCYGITPTCLTRACLSPTLQPEVLLGSTPPPLAHCDPGWCGTCNALVRQDAPADDCVSALAGLAAGSLRMPAASVRKGVDAATAAIHVLRGESVLATEGSGGEVSRVCGGEACCKSAAGGGEGRGCDPATLLACKRPAARCCSIQPCPSSLLSARCRVPCGARI